MSAPAGNIFAQRWQFCIGTHKVSLRVPLGSSASQLDADQLKSQFKTLLARFVEDQPTCETAIREWHIPTSMDVSAAPALGGAYHLPNLRHIAPRAVDERAALAAMVSRLDQV